jgi:hypothetical protein
VSGAEKARAVYRALEKTQSRGLLGLSKTELQRACRISHSMSPSQVESGLAALGDGEMLKYAKTVVTDRVNGKYRIVDVAVLADRNAWQRDVDYRTKWAITLGRRTKTRIKSFIDDAVTQGDTTRAMALANIDQRADDMIANAQHLRALARTL